MLAATIPQLHTNRWRFTPKNSAIWNEVTQCKKYMPSSNKHGQN